MDIKKIVGNRVAIKITKQEKTPGGIIIPSSANEDENVGVVYKLGDGRFNNDGSLTPISFVKEGEKVLYKKGYSVNEIEKDSEKIIIIDADDVVAVLAN